VLTGEIKIANGPTLVFDVARARRRELMGVRTHGSKLRRNERVIRFQHVRTQIYVMAAEERATRRKPLRA